MAKESLKHFPPGSMRHQLQAMNSGHLLRISTAKQNRSDGGYQHAAPFSPPDPNPLCSPPRGPIPAMICSTFYGQTSLTTTSSWIWLKFQALYQGTELKIPSLATETLSVQYSVLLISICKLKNSANHLLPPWTLGRMNESPLFALGSSWKLDKHTEG